MSNVIIRLALAASATLLAAACATQPSRTGGHAPSPHYKVGKPYKINGRWYRPAEEPDYNKRGVASWYGDDFHGRPTANGEIFDMGEMTAAHTTLPMPSMVEVTNLENGRRAVVRVNDRGPFAHNRIIDLSRAAARKLGFEHKGLANVRVRYLSPAPLPGEKTGPLYARRKPAAAPIAVAMSPVREETNTDHLAGLITNSDPGREPNLPPPLPVTSELLAAESLNGELAAPSSFAIQVAVLDNIEDLPGLRERLASEGPLRIARADDGGEGERYRINLGPFPSETIAADRLEVVREAGYDQAVVVAISP